MRTPPRLVVVLLALALPATASAADPWSAPAPIRERSIVAPLAGPPGLAVSARGLALAVANTGGSGDFGPRTTASVFDGDGFSDPAPLTGRNVAMGPGSGRVLAYGRSRLLGAGVEAAQRGSRVVVAFGRLVPGRAMLGEPRGVGPAGLHAHGAEMAVNAAGDAAVVYPVCRDAGCRRVLVYLAVRRAGTSEFRSTRLAEGDGPPPRVAAAINRRGDALAVWTLGSSVHARVRTAGGTLRDRQRVGPTRPGQHLAPSAVLSRHRGELVGWLAQQVGEGAPSGGAAWVAQARDGGAFTRTQLGTIPAAGAGRGLSEAGVRVAYGTGWRALVAWTAFDGASPTGRFITGLGQLRGAANNPDQRLVGVRTVSNPAVNTVLSSLVADREHPETVLMLEGVPGTDPGGPVSVRASGGEEVAAPGPGAYAVDAARLPDGRVLAAWATSQGDAFSVRAAPPG